MNNLEKLGEIFLYVLFVLGAMGAFIGILSIRGCLELGGLG